MEERVILPFMTEQEEEVYRRYYGEQNLPPRHGLPVQYASVRRPSYPPSRSPIIRDNMHFGETSSEMVGNSAQAYVSTPNVDTQPRQQRTYQQPLRPDSPGTITIPSHVRLSHDYAGPRPIIKEPEPKPTTFIERLMDRTQYASRGSKPSTMRHFLRTLQFLSSALVLVLAILTHLVIT